MRPYMIADNTRGNDDGRTIIHDILSYAAYTCEYIMMRYIIYDMRAAVQFMLAVL